LARWHRVAAYGASTADQRDDVVHREGLRADLTGAVVTRPGGDPSTPPGSLAQRSSLRLLAAQSVVVSLGYEPRAVHQTSSLRTESRSDSSSHSFMSQATRSSVSLRA